MKFIYLIIFLIIPLTSFSQRDFGVYGQAGSETFYNKNMYASIGIRYKEVRLGYMYQSATINHSLYVRKGFAAEVGLLNVDKCAYISIGARVMTTNDDFVTVVPHFTVAFRYKFVELPISFSGFKGYTTGLIGLRLLF